MLAPFKSQDYGIPRAAQIRGKVLIVRAPCAPLRADENDRAWAESFAQGRFKITRQPYFPLQRQRRTIFLKLLAKKFDGYGRRCNLQRKGHDLDFEQADFRLYAASELFSGAYAGAGQFRRGYRNDEIERRKGGFIDKRAFGLKAEFH